MAEKMSKSNPCRTCDGLCCRYVALPIDDPETAGDFDDIRWYIAHDRVSVFVDEGDWYVNFKSKCRHLSKDRRCDMYAKRPRICRNHKSDNCEFNGEGEIYEMEFTTPEQIEEYAKQFLRKKYARRKRRKKR